MGLDMYLRKNSVFSSDAKTNEAIIHFLSWINNKCFCSFNEWCGNTTTVNDLPDIKTLVEILEKRQNECIGEEVYYWRKANAIHRWFVENIQDGVDDCRKHRPITKQDLETLKTLCDRVLENHEIAKDVLPTMPGFFFGVYDYDETYFDKVENTSEICRELIDEFDFDKYELYYITSW